MYVVSQVFICLQLLDFNTSIKTWNSVHFLGHFLMVAIILVSLVNPPRKPRKKEAAAADKHDKTGQAVPPIQAGMPQPEVQICSVFCTISLTVAIILVSLVKPPRKPRKEKPASDKHDKTGQAEPPIQSGTSHPKRQSCLRTAYNSTGPTSVRKPS